MKTPEFIYIVRRSEKGKKPDSLLFVSVQKAMDQYSTWMDVYSMFENIEIDLLMYKLVNYKL